MTIKECIDIVDNVKPNQYSPKDKVMWLSFIDEVIINEVLKTHEGYDGRYDEFTGYTEDKLSVPLVVPSPYDRLYTAYLKMKIDRENGETARYNNSAAEFNAYMMEYRKYYNKTHMPLSTTDREKSNRKGTKLEVTEAQLEFLKRELYPILAEDINTAISDDKIYAIVMNYVNNNIDLLKGAFAKDVDEAIKTIKTADGTVVSQNADFAEVAEWWDGNPTNEDRTGYFVCANVPVDGIVMKKATSIDDVKGVTILAPAFAGNFTKDKVDSDGNLLPKYSYVAIIGFVPVIDNGTCTVGGRCMPDDNGCAIPSSNSMGYQVVNRIDENRVLIIIEPNGDMVQRIKTRVNQMQEDIDHLEESAIDKTKLAELFLAAVGKNNVVEGKYAIAVGTDTLAKGGNSYAGGDQTIAYAKNSMSLGYRTIVGVEGNSEKAKNSFAHGEEILNAGYASAAFGLRTEVKGAYAFVTGSSSKAYGNSSYAAGNNALANGWASLAIGNSPKAYGEGALALGGYAKANPDDNPDVIYTISIGHNTKATKSYQTALGKFNDTDDNAVLIVGNGSSDSARSNAFTVNKIGTASVKKDPINAMDVATKQYVDSLRAEVDSMKAEIDVLKQAIVNLGGTI